MNHINTETLLCAGFFILSFVTGMLLKKSGRPINSLKLTIHKLISLGTLVLSVLIVYRSSRGVEVGALPSALAAISGLLFLALIASGGWISARKEAGRAVTAVHSVAPWLVLASTAATVILLAASR